jgi:hypothetical protein
LFCSFPGGSCIHFFEVAAEVFTILPYHVLQLLRI